MHQSAFFFARYPWVFFFPGYTKDTCISFSRDWPSRGALLHRPGCCFCLQKTSILRENRRKIEGESPSNSQSFSLIFCEITAWEKRATLERLFAYVHLWFPTSQLLVTHCFGFRVSTFVRIEQRSNKLINYVWQHYLMIYLSICLYGLHKN